MPTLALDGGVVVDVTIQNPPTVTLVQGNVASAEIYVAGPQGPKGNRGTIWHSGVGAPAGTLGVLQDWYLNTDNGDVYEKTGDLTWTLRDNLTGRAATDTAQTWTRPQTFAMALGTDVPITIRSHADGVTDLQRWQNSAGTTVARVMPNGGMEFTSSLLAPGGGFSIGTQATTAGDGYLDYAGAGNLYIRRSGNAAFGKFDSLSRFGLGVAPTDALAARFTVVSRGAAEAVAIVKAAVSQTADLTQWQDSAGAVLSRVASNGFIYEGANRVFSAGNANLATTVTATTTYGLASAVGTGVSFARNDHSHGTPPAQVLTAGVGIATTLTGVDYTIANTGVLTVTASGNLASSGGQNPAISISATPTFSWVRGTVTAVETEAGTRTDIGGARIVFEDGSVVAATVGRVWEIDNAAGTMRFYTPGAVRMTLSTAGALNTAGAITENGVRVYSATTPNLATTVVAATTYGLASAVGVGTAYARNDHTHGTPTAQTITAGAGITATASGVNYTIANSGVTSIVAGTNITISGATGAVTVNANTASNVVTTDTAQTVTGQKIWSTSAVGTVNSIFRAIASQTADITQWQNSAGTNLLRVSFEGLFLNGAGTSWIHAPGSASTYHALLVAQATGQIPLTLRAVALQTADLQQWQDSAGTVLSRIASNGHIFEGANRVYSAGNPPPATDLSNYVTLNTAQTISAIKTFTAIPVVPDASFGVAKLSATGVRDATTFLRGDNTWATINISNMVTTDTAQTITGQKILSTVAIGTVNSIVRAIASQTADLVQWQSSASAVLSRVKSDGTGFFAAGQFGPVDAINASAPNPALFASAPAANRTVIVARAAASQTSDIMQFQDSAGNVLAKVANDGTIYKGNQIVGGNAADTEIMAIMGGF